LYKYKYNTIHTDLDLESSTVVECKSFINRVVLVEGILPPFGQLVNLLLLFGGDRFQARVEEDRRVGGAVALVRGGIVAWSRRALLRCLLGKDQKGSDAPGCSPSVVAIFDTRAEGFLSRRRTDSPF
jgi:hypothetical protein